MEQFDQVQQVHLETTVSCTHGYKEHWIYMEQFDQVQQVHLMRDHCFMYPWI